MWRVLTIAAFSVALAVAQDELVLDPDAPVVPKTDSVAVTSPGSADTLAVTRSDSLAAVATVATPADTAALPDTIGNRAPVPAPAKPQLLPALDARQSAPIVAVVNKKKVAVLAGAGVLAAGALLDYGLIMRSQADLDPMDIGGQLALISPQILAFGLRVAGPSMAAMRTSEVADSWKRYTDRRAPKRSRAWWLYYVGWGLYVAHNATSYMPAYDSTSGVNWEGWSLAMGICSDVAWAATIGYSWWYLMHIRSVAQGKVPEKPRVTVYPAVGRDGAAGLRMAVSF